MSRHRDIKNAQAELNEAIGRSVRLFKRTGMDWLDERVVDAWDEFERLRNEFDGPGAASARDTSINAAHADVPRKGSMRRQIVEVIAAQQQQFGHGITCDQLEARLRKSHQTVSPAVNAMEQAGWIKDSGERRATRNKKPAIVWVPTDKLVDRLREIGLGD